MPRNAPHPAKALLVARGESQKEAAAHLGVSANTFCQILNGNLSPWPKLRRDLAEHLGVDESDAWHDMPSLAARSINERAAAAEAGDDAVRRVAAIIRHGAEG